MSHPKLLGYEILRRVARRDLPSAYPIDPQTTRAVLGTARERFLVPPGIDVLELGLIDTPGSFELLPIDLEHKPRWQEVTDLLITQAQADRQHDILLRSYHALCGVIMESAALQASVDRLARRGVTHPVFGILRLEAIEVWRAQRRGTEPISEAELDRLHGEVAHRVAGRIRARLVATIH